jgi:hypothetical protein
MIEATLVVAQQHEDRERAVEWQTGKLSRRGECDRGVARGDRRA